MPCASANSYRWIKICIRLFDLGKDGGLLPTVLSIGLDKSVNGGLFIKYKKHSYCLKLNINKN